MGTSYGQLGIDQGKSVLSDLAHHPATAEHIAFKLIRHFITDEPTSDLVNPVAHAFLISEGDLKATAQALIDLPAAWSLPLTKARTPYELQIAEMRAMGTLYAPEARWPFTAPLQALGHLPWQRSTPDGYPDESAYWLGPDAMRIRLETAQLNARTLQEVKPLTHSPVQVAERLFGTYLSAPSRQAIADAWTQTDGIATLFMIPEFQRR
jgi:uncharacterized protein (DUF1800 family)